MPADFDFLMRRLWCDYAALNPQAARIHALLSARGETVVNDHIAFRTLDTPAVGLDALSRVFLRFGYAFGGAYDFPDRHVRAVHLQHADAARPKIFLSELLASALPAGLHSILLGLLNQISPAFLADPFWCAAGRPWNLARADYEALARASEYAAWLAAFGFGANHFTVSANALHTFASLRELNAFLQAQGFALNADGGEIKGGPEVYLEQSSTLAPAVRVGFADETADIPGCYYEFALRHRLPSGARFEGFVAYSAARIFTSTDRRTAA